MLTQAANSQFFEIIQRIDPDFLGSIGLVVAILTFVLLIVSVIFSLRTIQNISMAKMQNQMVNELLAKGYSVQEIQQLVYNHRRNVLFRFFDNRKQGYVNRNPSPPIKRAKV